MNGYLRRIIFFALLIITWVGVSKLEIWPPYLFPTPWGVSRFFTDSFKDNMLSIAIIVSLGRVLKGYLISLLIGIPMGLLVGRHKWLEETLGSLLLGLQTLPSICWLPLAVLWFGLNEKAILFIVVLGAIFSVSLATQDGVKNVQPIFLKAAQNMGATGKQIYFKVIIPAALPTIVTGMKIAWSFAWRALMAGELLSSGVGLGQVLMMGRDLADMNQVVAVMIIIALLGLLIDRLFFSTLEKNIRTRWGLEK